jgi:hypothetical protein
MVKTITTATSRKSRNRLVADERSGKVSIENDTSDIMIRVLMNRSNALPDFVSLSITTDLRFILCYLIQFLYVEKMLNQTKLIR